MYTIEKEMFEGKEIRVAVDGDEKYYLTIDFVKDLGYMRGATDVRSICDEQDVKMIYPIDVKRASQVMPARSLSVTAKGFEELKKHRTKFPSVAIEKTSDEEIEQDMNLTLFNKEIIPTYRTDDGVDVVIGRELHSRLKIGTKYRDWFRRMLTYGFQEGVDYFPLLKSSRPVQALDKADFLTCENICDRHNLDDDKKIDHVMTLDMAKHLAMIQRTPQGMEIRQKLIELEKMVSQNKGVNTSSTNVDYDLLKKVCDALTNQHELSVKQCEILSIQEKMIVDLSHQVDELRGDFLRSVTPVLEASNLQEQNPYIKIINKGPVSENVTNIAKVYGYKAQDLNKILKDLGIQEKEGSGWKLCSKYEGYGYTAPGATYTNSDGSTTTQMKWTRKGRYFIHDLLTANGLV